MKKLIAILFPLLLLFSVVTTAETVSIDTPYGKKNLYVPDDYDTLRDYYIEIATMYQEQKHDLEIEIQNVDKALQAYDTLKESLTKLQESVDALLKEPEPEPIWINGVYLKAKMVLPATQSFSLGYMALLFGSYSISVGIGYPFSAELGFGIYF